MMLIDIHIQARAEAQLAITPSTIDLTYSLMGDMGQPMHFSPGPLIHKYCLQNSPQLGMPQIQDNWDYSSGNSGFVDPDLLGALITSPTNAEMNLDW